MDTEARKQLLLTRIALERAQWTREVDALQRAVQPRRLLPALVRATLGTGWVAGLFARLAGPGTAAAGLGVAGRLVQGLLLLRRHPVLWPLLAGAWPWVRQRGRMAGIFLWLPLGVGVAAAVWLAAKRRPGPRIDDERDRDR